ncbi:MAG: hypothetical protein H6553_04120 [Chitinophagales bacterium]|nr:hypothetical protein [Chitinophagales bacterium]
MSISTIDKEIIEKLPLLGDSEKENILRYIESYVKITDIEERISIEQYNKEIDEAMKRIDKGQYITHEELAKESETW